jgi:hypothetical protein
VATAGPLASASRRAWASVLDAVTVRPARARRRVL